MTADQPSRPLPAPRIRPFRFSSAATGANTATALRDRARMLEDLGYSTITIADHFDDQLGPIAALMAAAEATTTLKVAPLVFCNDYRHPVVLAKEAATLDLLSEGRLEFGLGAGWKPSDYVEAGITEDRPGVRIARMAEAVTIIKGLWADGPVDFAGEHYTITGLEGTPKPHQRPHPPIIIGGGGKRLLSIAGREADIVGLSPTLPNAKVDEAAGPNATADATDQRLAWIRDAAGDRFDEIELQIRLELVYLTDEPQPFIDAMAGGFGLTPDEAANTPFALIGPTSLMAEALIARRERWGLNYIGIPAEAAESLGPVVAELAGK